MLHSWVAVDLELSLFHDTPPKLDTASISFALPNRAVAAQDTHMTLENWKGETIPTSQSEHECASVAGLFRTFMTGHISLLEGIPLTHLRLLLDPLQTLSMHLHQCLDAFGNVQNPGAMPNTAFNFASKALVEEHMSLLARWHQLAISVSARSEGASSAKLEGSLALYHIMVINSLASFQEVERLTQQQTGGVTAPPSPSHRSWLRTASAVGLGPLMFNCRECLNILRTMPTMERPVWWPAALYRVALVLCQAVISINSKSPNQNIGPDVEHHDPTLRGFLDKLHIRPVLTSGDSNAVMLVSEISVLDHCISLHCHVGAASTV